MNVSTAAVNGPTHTVVAGPDEDVHLVVRRLQGDGIPVRFLKVSHAFHSCLMDGVLDDLEWLVAGVSLKPLTIPMVSNVTGQMLPVGVSPGPAYWRHQTRHAVRFAEGVKALAAAGCTLFLEIGPTPHLTHMVRRILPNAVCLPSLNSSEKSWRVLLRSLGTLYVHGITPDWAAVPRSGSGRRVPLPTYPFGFRQ